MAEDELVDPLETVTVLKSDLELQNRAMGLAVEDVWSIARECGIPRDDRAPAEVVEQIVTVIRKLRVTQQFVDEAEGELRARAARFGNQTIDLGNGAKGLLVGKKLPPGSLTLAPPSRAERRRIERERGR